MAYRSLSPEQQARFEPMITGFNPADMYAADHIRRVLKTFPGVFSGIGEFTIHKEFVSSKISGETASLTNPALDRVLDFAAEAGLVVLIHNDADVPFPKEGAEPAYLTQMKVLLKRHPNGPIISPTVVLGESSFRSTAMLRCWSRFSAIQRCTMFISIFPGTQSQSTSLPALRVFVLRRIY
jgi:hypothetical protein